MIGAVPPQGGTARNHVLLRPTNRLSGARLSLQASARRFLAEFTTPSIGFRSKMKKSWVVRFGLEPVENLFFASAQTRHYAQKLSDFILPTVEATKLTQTGNYVVIAHHLLHLKNQLCAPSCLSPREEIEEAAAGSVSNSIARRR